MNERKRYLSAVDFCEPDRIPCWIGLSSATWCKYKGELENIVRRHPFIFGLYKKRRDYCKFLPHQCEGYFTDPWGCIWRCVVGGLTGMVVRPPLEKWNTLEKLKIPDITQTDWDSELNWENIKQNAEATRRKGGLVRGHLTHGFMYQRLYYIRGFNNFMIDLATGDSRLSCLIEIVLNRNMQLVYKWLEIKPDIIHFGDDLGMQNSLMISPKLWRRYIKPCYKKLFGAVRRIGVNVYFHTDGHVLEIIPDLIECGINVLNPQSGANGINEVAKLCKEKVCVDIDLDRQEILPHGSSKDIRDHVKEAVMKLGSKKGGLILSAGIYPDVPLDNIETLCQAMEKYSIYYS